MEAAAALRGLYRPPARKPYEPEAHNKCKCADKDRQPEETGTTPPELPQFRAQDRLRQRQSDKCK